MSIAQAKTRRWTVDEYYRIAEAGLFDDQRVELIDGEIIQRPPQSSPHALGIGKALREMNRLFGDGYWVRPQMPLKISKHSEPEPDVAVVKGKMDDFKDHPSTAVLIIEVSTSTLAYDLGKKANLYASAGIKEYWVVDCEGRQLHVFRNPVVAKKQLFGWRYEFESRLNAAQHKAPAARPKLRVAVGDLLP